ncbi:sugar ABC transporter substrate-binding protein [Agathobaculum sp. NTUH-O15-33]|uniref:sugar ABC transporter substrate-binding protein n=1 Tax=Agathobaculum sp. NTUH-O15-33 TaxID=3079302 RepID=UPI002958A724|nr:sugar ABC transporter substrate-binding protein [Agathobaculum sp. NTUH-O15-33]WNX84243.1 sugar ABC transporter substrate-binding protein [Agathobaculum sp. NTUH-O15-33]
MKLRKWIAITTVLAMLGMTGCTPAADSAGKAATPDESPADSGAAAATASEFESLEPVNIEDFMGSPVISDYIPDECNLSGTKEDGSKWKLAWCCADDSDESMAFMTGLMQQAADEYGFELVRYDAQSDPQKQTDHINNAITQGCDAIIVNPVDASALSIPMKKAKDAGLVVINSQNRIADTSGYDCYVGPDDTMAAQQMASVLMEMLPDGGKIVMIDGMMGSTAQINRTAGFRGVMQNYPQYEIVEEQSAQWSTAEAMNIMESYLSKYPEIDAVFSHFDLATLAAIQSTQNVGREDEIMFFSVDGTQGALDEIAKNGCFKSTSMQDFKANTAIQVMAALAYLNGDGDKVDKETVTPNVVITADNAGKFEAGWG